MTFSLSTKEELAMIAPDSPCCSVAELAGLSRGGRLQLSGRGRAVIVIATELAKLARKVLRLSKEVLGQKPETRVLPPQRLRRTRVYELRLPATREQLVQLGILTAAGGIADAPPAPVTERVCCRRAYLRGLFLAAGSVSDPSGSLHLEMMLRHASAADGVSQLLFAEGVRIRLGARKQHVLLYLKEGEQIARFLTVIGAHAAVLRFENARAYRDMKGHVNRLVNAETANLDKAVQAGLRQVDDIRVLASTIGLNQLPPPLREVAELRMRHPEASLTDLGRRCRPPVSKSGVNHRLRRLRQLADEQRDKGYRE